MKPYGDQDPYAEIELVAYSRMVEKQDSEGFFTDLMPVRAARVSHANDHTTGADDEADDKLMQYLAKHKHMTPFEHQSATFRVVAPLFVFREWHRHRTQSYNEMSMRYTSDPVGKLFKPERWRKQASKNKQSSAGALEGEDAKKANLALTIAYQYAIGSYEKLIALGVARELARIVVPVGNYSEMYATANLRNWAAFCALRCADGAQWEIRQYAIAINTALVELWPRSWKVMQDHIIHRTEDG